MLLGLALLSPYVLAIPYIHILQPNICRAIQAASIEGMFPQWCPEALPPRDIRPPTEDMLVEEDLASWPEYFNHEVTNTLFGVWNATER